MTIYVPDDLAGEVKEFPAINVSGVCQRALRSELGWRRAVTSTDDMERQTVYTEAMGDLAFIGRLLTTIDPPGDGPVAVYLTKRHRIAVYNDSHQTLDDYDTFADLANAPFGAFGPLMLSDVASALGVEHVTELDI